VLARHSQFGADFSDKLLVFLNLPNFSPERVIVASDVVTGHEPKLINHGLFVKRKSVASKPGEPKSEFALMIARLCDELKISQKDLATRIGVSGAAVTKWMKTGHPAPETLARLIELAAGTSVESFLSGLLLQKAPGAVALARQEVTAKARSVYRRSPIELSVISTAAGKAADRRGLRQSADLVEIPLLADAAAAGEPRMIDRADVEDLIYVRALSCPHPDETLAIKVDGKSMSPVLETGYICVLDTHPEDMVLLDEEMVAACDPKGAVTIKWLRKTDAGFMLVPENSHPDFNPVLLSHEPGWKVIGKVIMFIGRPYLLK
jgi:SOS-response transcriptional repressor LexA